MLKQEEWSVFCGDGQYTAGTYNGHLEGDIPPECENTTLQHRSSDVWPVTRLCITKNGARLHHPLFLRTLLMKERRKQCMHCDLSIRAEKRIVSMFERTTSTTDTAHLSSETRIWGSSSSSTSRGSDVTLLELYVRLPSKSCIPLSSRPHISLME